MRRRDTTENRCEGNCECDDSQHDIHFSKSCTSQSSFHGFKFGSYSVTDKRLGNEIRILSQSKFRNCFTYNDSNGIFIFTFNMKVTEIANSNMKEKDDLNFKIMINTKDWFPFFPPSISFDWNAKHILFDVNKLTFEEIMQESWHPSLRIIDIIERSEAFILPLLEKSYHKPLTLCPILYLFEKVTSSIAVKTLIILFAVIIRIIWNIMYYESTFRSHFNTITHTLNNKIVDWYKFGDGHEFQTYPPLYGYLYYLVGMIQNLLISTPAEEIRSVDLKIAVTSALDYNTNNYIWIALLTLLEAFTLYSGVYMWVKSFYRKLTNQVKHSVILLALVCPVYLIANVLAIRFNSIMIGLMIWAVYFWVNSKSKMWVLCTTLAIHIEPKAFIFVLPMIIYTLKVNVILQ